MNPFNPKTTMVLNDGISRTFHWTGNAEAVFLDVMKRHGGGSQMNPVQMLNAWLFAGMQYDAIQRKDANWTLEYAGEQLPLHRLVELSNQVTKLIALARRGPDQDGAKGEESAGDGEAGKHKAGRKR